MTASTYVPLRLVMNSNVAYDTARRAGLFWFGGWSRCWHGDENIPFRACSNAFLVLLFWPLAFLGSRSPPCDAECSVLTDQLNAVNDGDTFFFVPFFS